MRGTITALYSYPIKGLSAVSHQSVALASHRGFPGDRLYGFAKASSGFDPAHPAPLPKDRFLVLMEKEKLAALTTSFDAHSHRFTVHMNGTEVLRADLSTQAGQDSAADLFVELLDLRPDERPKFVAGQGHRFTDVAVDSSTLMEAISFINLASVKAFENDIGAPVNPMRFRGNIVFDGWSAFSELEMVGRTFNIGDAVFKVLQRTQRCAATEVDPATAARDLKVPMLLRKTYGHFDMGIYADVQHAGRIAVGDQITWHN